MKRRAYEIHEIFPAGQFLTVSNQAYLGDKF